MIESKNVLKLIDKKKEYIMIKVVYYIGTYDKNTCKKELADSQFIKCFDEVFKNYTLQVGDGVYTMQEKKQVVREKSFIVTTYIECEQLDSVKNYCEVLKQVLNQECILVEISNPTVMFL